MPIATLLTRVNMNTRGQETLSQSILSGIFYLFEHYDGDEDSLRKTLGDFLLLTLGGVGA